MNVVVLSLGSNIGNRQGNLKKAVQKLEETKLKVLKISSIYETEPLGFTEQNKFFNIVLTAEFPEDPYTLLSKIKKIENDLGRERKFKNSPRTIDIDIITFNDQKIDSESLTIPHKEYENRKFVLIPLAEIEPNFIFDSKSTVNETLKRCNDNSEVTRISEFNNEI
ncbi:MAG: 2-amino-4-hydroxy-6-hydroxymethyldihydropteridine diphosphokinase [Candidatus Delongbacteria bacterium]|nr:2-amino-4-hydroxy-6-hydroxymethyldihydropteridine diphosphokinase [Candidatus Delongbacteria bacterium]